MSDSYQAIYDATRSRIGGCDAAAEIFRVALALEVERDELRALLAASQAHAKALREALERADAARCTCPCHTEGGYCDQCCCGVESANICRDALALPADTSALDAERAKERERVDELIAATEALIETAESHAMQSYDRGGVTGRKIDAARAAIRALEPRSGDGTNVPGPAPAEGGRETR